VASTEVAEVMRIKLHMPEIEQVDTPSEIVHRSTGPLLIGAAIAALLTIGVIGLVVWLLRPMGDVTSLEVPAAEPQAHPATPAADSIEPQPTTEEAPPA
jgi:hypothetical protein